VNARKPRDAIRALARTQSFPATRPMVQAYSHGTRTDNLLLLANKTGLPWDVGQGDEQGHEKSAENRRPFRRSAGGRFHESSGIDRHPDWRATAAARGGRHARPA